MAPPPYGDLSRKYSLPAPIASTTSYRDPFNVGCVETAVHVVAFRLLFVSRRKVGSPEGQVIKMLFPTRVIVSANCCGAATAKIRAEKLFFGTSFLATGAHPVGVSSQKSL